MVRKTVFSAYMGKRSGNFYRTFFDASARRLVFSNAALSDGTHSGNLSSNGKWILSDECGSDW